MEVAIHLEPERLLKAVLLGSIRMLIASLFWATALLAAHLSAN